MKKILQALDGASTKPVEGSNDMKKFLKLVSESDLNQPTQDPKYVEYAQLMAKYDMLAKEMTPDNSGVEKGASPEAIASVNAIKAKAQQLAGANLQAWEQARQKENAASMSQANANQAAMASQLEAVESESVGMSRLLSIISEGKSTKTNRLSQAENIVYMNTPKPQPVKLDETPGLFKTYLKLVEEEDINQVDNLKNKLEEHLQEVKSQQPPKPRNFVAKNAVQSGAGAHKDKKKAQKQGEVKHKNKALDMAESDTPSQKSKNSLGDFAPYDLNKPEYQKMRSDWESKKKQKTTVPGQSAKPTPNKSTVEEEKVKGVDGKACWKGKRYAGKVKKADGTYKDKCIPVNEGDE